MFPFLFAKDGWYTVSYISSKLKVSRRTVTYWATHGLFVKMGLKVLVAPTKGGSGRDRIWIYVPDGDVSKFAILKPLSPLPLDKVIPSTLISDSARSITGSGTPSLC